MGWDVVQIGLRHNLPIDDPMATAKKIATRMKQNIRLVARDDYRFDTEKNLVYSTHSWDCIELGTFKVNDFDKFFRLTVLNYQANQILDQIGVDNLKNIQFADEDAEFLICELERPFALYELDYDDDGNYMQFFRECINLDICVIERWWTWVTKIREKVLEDNWLWNYRKRIYDRAKLFGCNEVVICSDQGPTELMCELMNKSADELVAYTKSRKYIDEVTWDDEKDKEDWINHGKQIQFSEYFSGTSKELLLSEDDFVEVVFDDFKDLESLDDANGE